MEWALGNAYIAEEITGTDQTLGSNAQGIGSNEP